MTEKNGYCHVCNADRKLEMRIVEQTFPVRGEPVSVDAEVAYCTVCGQEVPDKSLDFAALDRAYAKYRRLKNLPTADEIVALRRKYGLGQRALAKLLAWSPATVYRYEKGAVPVPSHAEIIKKLTDPSEMERLLERNADRLTRRELARVKHRLHSLAGVGESATAISALENWAASVPIDIKSGFRRFAFEKFLNMVLLFTQKRRMSKISLMKHLWYADFLHFKKHDVSISGARYAALPHGPALDKWMLCLEAASETGAVSVESELLNGNKEVDFVSAGDRVDESAFTPEELMTLKEVAQRLHGLNAETLSEMSHRENAWSVTPRNGIISYEHALALHWPPEREF